ncbi:MAG: Na+/H+ antiporter NhaA [Vicinamibacterales bacterium]
MCPDYSSRDRLERPVDPASDHILGPADAEITLVEYGSYACPHCRAANERIAEVRAQFGDRLRYVFRHRPIAGDLARQSAVLAESAVDEDQFWEAHVALMTRSEALNEDDLRAVAADMALNAGAPADPEVRARANARVDADIAGARASGVFITPTFFINDRRYEGLWEETGFTDALIGSLGHRVRSAALDFARWAPSAGLLLVVATLLAIGLTNSPAGAAFTAFWQQQAALAFGGAAFSMSLLHWINDGLLTLFFLVVGLEIKREFSVGHLSSRRSAALPIAAAIGGMAVPVLLYSLAAPSGPWTRGWGVPMATDTAFAVALIIMLGTRVPIELRIFLTAAAIVDDIGAILVVAFFYSGGLHVGFLIAAAAVAGMLALLNRGGVYSLTPYLLLGLALWATVHAGGLHATLAGVVLAAFIPTRPPADLRTLRAQADAILIAEARRGDVLRGGPSEPAMRALDAIHDRLESPADRMLRTVSLRSSYIVLPLFALANAGVALSADVLTGRGPLMMAIALGLVAGKPLGIVGACALAVRLKVAEKPAAYTWRQLAGAGALAGIGFTMSLFIASEAFHDAADFAAAKIAVFGASVISAMIGIGLLWQTAAPVTQESRVLSGGETLDV